MNVKSNNISTLTVLLFVLQNNLLNMVCSSLVNKSCTPGQKDWDKKTSVWSIIKNLATEITTEDPEFLLKVCDFSCVSACGLCCQVVMLSTCVVLHICVGFRLQSILGRN